MADTEDREMEMLQLGSNARKPVDRKTGVWRKAWHKFFTETTIHGMNHVAEPQPYLMRRILWMLLLLLGTGLFGYMMVNSIIYYYSWPVTVNVKINYNDTVTFPTVTLCNKNAFKMTSAYEHGIYGLLSKMFEPGEEHSFEFSEYDSLNITNITMEELYLQLGHKKEDLIVKCRWDGSPCEADAFTTVITDYGLCYTFNGPKKGIPPKKAGRTGAHGGLRLLLNVEQYEYMRGPNTGAGLKVLIHDQLDSPLVRDYGIAIAPGAHAVISTKILTVHNLPPPHGLCNDSMNLTNFDQYSQWNCLMDRKIDRMGKACACRDAYMPSRNGSFPPCTLRQNQDCVRPIIEGSAGTTDARSGCEVACRMTHFDTLVSYASTSNYDVDKLLHSNHTKALKERYVSAREITQQTNEDLIETDRHHITSLVEAFHNFENIILTVEPYYKKCKDYLELILRSLESKASFHLRSGLEAVKFTVEHKYIRAWKRMEERTLYYVVANFHDITSSFERTMAKMVDFLSRGKVDQAEALLFMSENSLQTRLLLVDRAKDNITEINRAYTTGIPLIEIEQSLNGRYDLSFVPIKLFRQNRKAQDTHYHQSLSHLNDFRDGIQMLIRLGKTFFHERKINDSAIEEAKTKVADAARSFNGQIYRYEMEIVKKPNEVIDAKISNFSRLNRTFFEAFGNVLASLYNIENTIEDNRQLLGKIVKIVNITQQYLIHKSMSKTKLADKWFENEVMRSMAVFEQFCAELRSLDGTLNNDWDKIQRNLLLVVESMIEEEITRKFYKMLNDDYNDYLIHPEKRQFYLKHFDSLFQNHQRITDRMLPSAINANLFRSNKAVLVATISNHLDDLSSSTDVPLLINGTDKDLLYQVARWNTNLKRYHEKNEIDADFYRQNFLKMDLFMKELSYEEIIQEKAYDSIKLLSDIGGSMGLFIGGSFISIFEILDVIIYSTVRRITGQ